MLISLKKYLVPGNVESLILTIVIPFSSCVRKGNAIEKTYIFSVWLLPYNHRQVKTSINNFPDPIQNLANSCIFFTRTLVTFVVDTYPVYRTSGVLFFIDYCTAPRDT